MGSRSTGAGKTSRTKRQSPGQPLSVSIIRSRHFMNTMKIEIYSDLICPWCYIGKRRMQAGLKLLGKEFAPKIVWRPFQLNPDMPIEGMNRKNYRTKKYGSWERSMAMDAGNLRYCQTNSVHTNTTRVFSTFHARGHIALARRSSSGRGFLRSCICERPRCAGFSELHSTGFEGPLDASRRRQGLRNGISV